MVASYRLDSVGVLWCERVDRTLSYSLLSVITVGVGETVDSLRALPPHPSTRGVRGVLTACELRHLQLATNGV